MMLFKCFLLSAFLPKVSIPILKNPVTLKPGVIGIGDKHLEFPMGF